MRLIRLNTRWVRFICFAFGLVLAYGGYRQFPLASEPTLGVVAETMGDGLDQILGTAMLIIGSFLASISTAVEGVYAYQGWNRGKHWSNMVNLIFAILLFAFVAYLTWPGFQWALAIAAITAIAIIANKLMKRRK